MDWPELFARRALGMRLGLKAIEDVYAALGRPAADKPAIHVVGTNGKGSTAAMAAHALHRHGRRVGLYTSPHLVRVGERVRVDAVPADDDVLLRHVEAVVAAEGVAPRPLTFFELLTLAALRVFAEADVDVVVAEAGLGGRLDATRVVSPVATVVTSIGLENTRWLGETLAAIAAEKAAVFVRGVPVFAAPAADEVRAVLERAASDAGTAITFPAPLPRPPIGLAGVHQAHNGALALAAARVLVPEVTAADLDGVRWPGRADRRDVGAGQVWLDVAHNAEGMAALIETLRGQGVVPDRVLVSGMDDKPIEAMLEWLATLGAPLSWVDLGPGSAPAPSSVVRRYDDPIAAWTDVHDEVVAGACVLVCGSVRLVGGVLAAMEGVARPDAQDPVRAAEREAASPIFGADERDR